MAKKWAEVTSSAEYQALSLEDKESARQQYFQEVITPQLPAEEVEAARAQFDRDTKAAGAAKPKKAFDPWEVPERLPPGAPFYVRGSATTGAKQVVGALLETPLSMATAGGSGILGGALGAATVPLRAGYGMARGESPSEALESGMRAGAGVLGKTQEALTYQPRTESAQAIQRGVGGAIEKTGEAIGEVGAAVGRPFGPRGEALGRTVGETTIPAVSAYYGAKGLAGTLQQARAARIGPPAPLPQPQQAIAEAQQAGFKAQPSVAKPSVASSTLETLADPNRTRAYLSEQNAAHASKLAREDLGIPARAPLDERSIAALRDQHNAKYDAIKALPDQITSDAQYLQQIRDLDIKFRNIKEHVPDLYNQSNLERVRGALAQSQSPTGKWTPAALIDISKRLRADASTLLNSRDVTPDKLGAAMAMKKGASAVEGMLERHLKNSGQSGLLREFRNARTQLAKIHAVEETTNLVTGEINPQAVRVLMENGEPLTGNLHKIARAAAAMPGVMQSTESAAGKGLGHLSDIGAGHALAGVATGRVDAAAGTAGVLGVRPGIRKVLGSEAYQRRMATPTPTPTLVGPQGAIPMGQAIGAGAAAVPTSPAYRLEDESINR